MCKIFYTNNISFSWLFSVLDCRNSSETAPKRFSSTRRWTLKKSYRKKIFFSDRKIFSKKSWDFVLEKIRFFPDFSNCRKNQHFQKIKNFDFSKMSIFSTIWKIGKKSFFFGKKSQLFLENIFRPEKNKKFRWDFF